MFFLLLDTNHMRIFFSLKAMSKRQAIYILYVNQFFQCKPSPCYATDNSISNNYSETFSTDNSMFNNKTGTFTSDNYTKSNYSETFTTLNSISSNQSTGRFRQQRRDYGHLNFVILIENNIK